MPIPFGEGGTHPLPGVNPARSGHLSMKKMLTEIQSGEYARKWIAENEAGRPEFNKTRAAELLGISFRSFRYKLKKFGIE